jgi:DNA-binding MurR/RpiR family transcriptional regulator
METLYKKTTVYTELFMRKITLQEVIDSTDGYSRLEKDIAEYINEHKVEVSQMNVSDLTKETFVSTGTLIRFVQKIGYSGFKEFKEALIKNIEQSKYLNQSVDFNKPFHNYSNTLDVVNSLSSLYKETIDVICSTLDIQQIERITDRIYSSKRIYLYGIGDSNITCSSFANRLIKLNINAFLANNNGEGYHIAKNTTKDDVVIFVSYSGNEVMNQSFQSCRENGTYLISITSNKESILANDSNDVILIQNKEENEDGKVSTFYSQLTFDFIFNVIYSLLYNKVHKIQTQRNIQRKLSME